jgi:flagellar protein FliJ
MTQAFALQGLRDIAESEADAAAASLGQLNRQVQLHERRLELLSQYRADYQERLRGATANGLDSAGLRNFNEFIARLEQAIGQQAALVEDARARAAQGREHWQARQRRSNAFNTLSLRTTANLLRQEASREQKSQDDFASRATRYNALARQ